MANPFAVLNRRTDRAPVNPLDKSTVVSIFPKKIDEKNPTITPGRFIIEKGSYDNPAILVVGPSSWWKELEINQPLLEIVNSSIQIADSIVKDYCNGIIGCNMADRMPGLFFIPGELTVEKVKKDYKGSLDAAKENQKRWYEELIRLADSDWARSNGNPLVITEDAKLAAREIGVAGTKDWMRDFQAVDMVRCVACGQLRNPNFPICMHCHAIIDKKKAEELGLVFAK